MDTSDPPARTSSASRATLIAACLAVAAFILGVVGYLQAGPSTIASAAYHSISLFTLTFVVPPGAKESSLPVALEVARFLAPGVTVLAAAGVAARIFRDQFDRRTARRRARRHAIVCGLGRVGSLVAAQLREHGHSVVAVERDAGNPAIPHVRALGMPVVVGDARSKVTLERAGVAHATRLVWSASEWVEGQAVVDAFVDTVRENLARATARRAATPGHWESVPACLVRVRDLALCTELRRDALMHRQAAKGLVPDVDFFNEAENSAQRLLWQVTRGYALVADMNVELWVLGSGVLAEALIVQAARNWWGAPRQHARPELVVHLCADDAASAVARIQSLWPEVRTACRVEAHAVPAEVAATTGAITAPSAVFVLLPSQERAIETGIRLIEETAAAHVVVAANPRYRPRVETDRLVLFDPVAYGLESDVLLFDTYELLARMIHAHYLTTRLRSDGTLQPELNPLGPGHEWNALDTFWRASNRDAARFVVPNLLDADFRIHRLSGRNDVDPFTSPFDASTLEGMAEREHERWRQFMTTEGWRPGQHNDTVARTRTDLVPWSDASVEARAYTCTAVSDYPRLLAQLGYEVRPRGR